jgi:hypothetical protein
MMTKMKLLASAAARDKPMAASVHLILDAALTKLSDGELGKKPTRGRTAARTAATEHHEAEAEQLAAEGAPGAAPDGAGEDELDWLDDPIGDVVLNAPESASVKRRNVSGTTQRASGNRRAKPSGSGGKKTTGGAGRSRKPAQKKPAGGGDSVGSKRTRTESDGQ